MGGIILYIYFLVLGFLYANELFRSKDIYFRSWMGAVFGNVILMAGIVIPAIPFGFTVLSHIILLVLGAVPYILILIKRKEKASIKDMLFKEQENAEHYMDIKLFCALILPISLIIWILMTNHILTPYDGGGVASGQSTFGDLQMHLSFVTSIAEQQKFPPDYSLLAGTKLNYPFFVDMLSSSLFLFGTPLRWAVLIPSYVISMLLVMGFYIVAFTVTKRKAAAVLATVFFFFCGGFGFSYFMNGAKADHSVFTKIFTEYYKTPTNYNENNIRWSNTICDMIIPQRTTMAGWCTILPAIWMLLEALKTRKRSTYIILGVFAGCMPMIHTHSFLALGMISAVMFFVHLKTPRDAVEAENTNKEVRKKKNERLPLKACEDKDYTKAYIINWVIFGAIAICMAFPQLMYWTFSQTSGNESFLKYGFNWVNEKDPYLWFYLKNWGIAALFAAPAIFSTSKDNKKLMLACGFIFVTAEFILFQPNKYDNNKLFYISYMMLLMVMSEWLLKVWDALKNVRGRAYLGAAVIAAGTFSGALTIGREFKSGGAYQTFSGDDIKMAEYIRENTPSDAVFLTGNYHLNPVCTLAGRTIYLGSSLYVYFHGMGDEFYKREAEIKKVYKGSYEDMKKFCEEKGIEYVYVGASESRELSPNSAMLNKLEKVHSIGNDTLYKVK